MLTFFVFRVCNNISSWPINSCITQGIFPRIRLMRDPQLTELSDSEKCGNSNKGQWSRLSIRFVQAALELLVVPELDRIMQWDSSLWL